MTTSQQETHTPDETAFAPLAVTGDAYYDDDDDGDAVHQAPTSHVSHPSNNQSSAASVLSQHSNSTSGGPRYVTTYRGGFATSLCDLFADPYDRSSCCALTCCGTLLQDRNTYVLTGHDPAHSSTACAWWLRLLVYGGVLILGCFWITGVLWGMDAAVTSVVVVGLVLGCRNTWQRQKLRAQLQQLLQEQQQQAAANSGGSPQEESSLYAAPRHGLEHWTCGCVQTDSQQHLVDANGNSQDVQAAAAMSRYQTSLKRRQQADLCHVLWHNCLAQACCAFVCKCWCQCCGMCATAQEDRELRRLFPKETFYMDYVTLQSWADYYPSIQWLRQQDSNDAPSKRRMSFWKHLGALSQLSQKLLLWLQVAVVLLLVAATFHLVEDFSVPKVIVVVATLAQSIVVVYVVYWRHHRDDLSLDAVIKYFASGFVLAMTVAMVVEMILDMIGTIVFTMVLTQQYMSEHPELLLLDDNNNEDPFANVDIFQQIASSHTGTFIVYLLFKALVVAAVVEEMTKYFCFWMVEHPDFCFDHGDAPVGNEYEVYNDLQLHVTAKQQQQLEATDDDTNEDEHVQVEDVDDNKEVASAMSQVPPLLTSPIMAHRTAAFRPRAAPRHSSVGAAITVAMVATAAGFSCCENLMYVFSQTSLAGEVTVLLARSALPVHSVCAAITSIGIVRRDVEQDASYGLGWSILPAVIVHGLFDFCILALAFFLYVDDDDMFATTTAPLDPAQQEQLLEQQAAAELAQQLYGFLIGAGITFFALVYYFVQAHKQRHRLNALEMTTAVPLSTVGRQTV